MAAVEVVIIIPTQGHSVGSFKSSAEVLARQLYSGRARIVRTRVEVSETATDVQFETTASESFSWSDAHHLKTVITISHGFWVDGPNLGGGLGDERFQPWGVSKTDSTKLSDSAKAFWTSVGNALNSDGKIVLVGCMMGYADYARQVAKVTGVSTYASTDFFAAGVAETTLKHLRAIESGKPLRPMLEFTP